MRRVEISSASPVVLFTSRRLFREVKHLFKPGEYAVGSFRGRLHEKRSHFALPSRIYFTLCHFVSGPFKVFGFEIANQKTIQEKNSE